jgi:hypothetical protein
MIVWHQKSPDRFMKEAEHAVRGHEDKKKL